MTEETTVEPLSPEEKAQLADLQYRQAMEEWQAREDDRGAKLAAIAPVATALGTIDDVDATISALEEGAEALDEDAAGRAQRVAQILRYDARRLIETYAQLQVAESEPAAPTA